MHLARLRARLLLCGLAGCAPAGVGAASGSLGADSSTGALVGFGVSGTSSASSSGNGRSGATSGGRSSASSAGTSAGASTGGHATGTTGALPGHSLCPLKAQLLCSGASDCCEGTLGCVQQICCNVPAAACGNDSDCCFGNPCDAGGCDASPLGHGCLASADCKAPGQCLRNACCAPLATTCAQGDECCSGLCQAGQCVCASAGSASRCLTAADCCSDNCDTTQHVCLAATSSSSTGGAGVTTTTSAGTTASTATTGGGTSSGGSTSGGGIIGGSTGGACASDNAACTENAACCSGACQTTLGQPFYCCETAGFSSAQIDCFSYNPCCDLSACDPFFGSCDPGLKGDPCVQNSDCQNACASGVCT